MLLDGLTNDPVPLAGQRDARAVQAHRRLLCGTAAQDAARELGLDDGPVVQGRNAPQLLVHPPQQLAGGMPERRVGCCRHGAGLRRSHPDDLGEAAPQQRGVRPAGGHRDHVDASGAHEWSPGVEHARDALGSLEDVGGTAGRRLPSLTDLPSTLDESGQRHLRAVAHAGLPLSRDGTFGIAHRQDHVDLVVGERRNDPGGPLRVREAEEFHRHDGSLALERSNFLDQA